MSWRDDDCKHCDRLSAELTEAREAHAATQVKLERVEQLRRMVEDPTMHSDETLRFAIANLMGWQVDMTHYERLRLLQDRYRAARGQFAEPPHGG